MTCNIDRGIVLFAEVLFEKSERWPENRFLFLMVACTPIVNIIIVSKLFERTRHYQPEHKILLKQNSQSANFEISEAVTAPHTTAVSAETTFIDIHGFPR